MATIVKDVELELTPADIVRAIRALRRGEQDELMREVQRLLIEEDTDVLDFVQAALPPEVGERKRWLESLPPTTEGDQAALGAVDDFCGMFPISDPELGHWLAERSEPNTRAAMARLARSISLSAHSIRCSLLSSMIAPFTHSITVL